MLFKNNDSNISEAFFFSETFLGVDCYMSFILPSSYVVIIFVLSPISSYL